MAKDEILLMGDDSRLWRMMGWMLADKGYRVEAAGNPEAALETLVKKNFDLIIARINLKDLQFLEILKKAKKFNPAVKVMVLSDNHRPVLPLEAYRIEVDDYLLMPVSPAAMCLRVSSCLEPVVDLKLQAPALVPVAEIKDRVLNPVMVMLHDLRGFLVSTAASVKLLLRGSYGELAGPAAAKLEELYCKFKQLTDLTEEFMTEVMSWREGLEVKTETLDLRRDVIEPVLQEVSEEVKRQGITLDNRLNSQPSRNMVVKGSKPWLKSVFRNLLKNGIKHGGRGCTIVVNLEKQGSTCRLHVYNTGRPIPEESRALLFSRRQTGGGGRRRSKDGMGLGLYLSRDIVKDYGGDLWYEAKAGGSNFVVALPQS